MVETTVIVNDAALSEGTINIVMSTGRHEGKLGIQLVTD